VVWDGRFSDFPELPPDDTAEIAGSCGARYVPTLPMMETEKRSLMFDYCDDGDVLLVIDADEVAVGDVKKGIGSVKANPGKSVFWVWYQSDVPTRSTSGWRPRLFRVRKGMRYSKRHDYIYWPDGSMVVDYIAHPDTLTNLPLHESGYNARITDFSLLGTGNLRSKMRDDARNVYFAKMGHRGWVERPGSRIIAGVMAYRDAEVLPKSLAPILPYVDGLVLMDGRLPFSKEQPDDGTAEVVRGLCRKSNVPLTVDSAEGVEFEIRTQMLQYVPDGDYLFMFDADEILEGDAGKMFGDIRKRPDIDIFWLKVEEDYFDSTPQAPWKAKVFKVRNGYHFYPNHWTLRDAEGKVVTDWTYATKPGWTAVEGAKMVNLGAKRPNPQARKERYETIVKSVDVHNDPNYELKLKKMAESRKAPVKVCPFCTHPWPRDNGDGTNSCSGCMSYFKVITMFPRVPA
jgi:hypothetical protein